MYTSKDYIFDHVIQTQQLNPGTLAFQFNFFREGNNFALP